jgi:hypothetical protein
MNKFAIVTIALSMFAVSDAFACEGKTVIFEDKFADDKGGWVLTPTVVDLKNRR